MDCSPPRTVVHGILQARILEWVAISYARGSSQPRNRTLFSFIAGRLFTSYKGRPLQSTEQHLQLLPLDVSRSPIPCPPPPVRRRKRLQTLLKVPWDNIPLVQNHCSRAFLMQRTHKPHWKYHFHPLLHCSVLPNKSVLFLNIRSCFPGGSDGKASAYNAGDLGSIPVLGRCPGEGSGCLLHCSCLEKSMDRGAWQAIVHGVTKSRIQLMVWSVVDGL